MNLGAFVALIGAMVAGIALPLQAGANAQLARALGHPAAAALVSASISALSMVPVMLLLRVSPPSFTALAAAPAWVYVGGLCGIGFLAVAITTAPVLGAATFIAVAVAGQMIASVAFDHFGLVGFPERPATPLRLLGIALVVVGVALVQFIGQPKGP
jgi:transporter family-2 protein